MKLFIKHSAIALGKTVRSQLRDQLGKLEPLRQIDEAHVHLVREHEASPPYQVRVQLVTPGPDVFAQAKDHTLRAALEKVIRQLGQIITTRARKQRARLTKNLRMPARPARGGA